MSGPDILREVEESIRAEKAAKFWQENSKFIIVMIAAIILGTAAQSAWTAYKKGQDEASVSLFLDALKDKESASALEKLSKDGKGSGSALAGLNGAAMAVSKQDWKNAITLYQNVIANKSVSQPYKDLAVIELVSIQLDHDDKATGDDLLKTLSPLIKDKKSPWYTKAILLSSVIKSSKNKDMAGAKADLKILMDMTTLPASFSDQVKALNDVYTIQSGSK